MPKWFLSASGCHTFPAPTTVCADKTRQDGSVNGQFWPYHLRLIRPVIFNECFFFLSCSCFSISSNQSDHSLLTPFIKNVLLPKDLPLFGYFLTIPYKPAWWLWVKIQVDQLFLKQSNQPIWHQRPVHVQSHLSSPLWWLLLTSAERNELCTDEQLNECSWHGSNYDWFICLHQSM